MSSPPDSVVGKGLMFSGYPLTTFVRSSGQILLIQYLMNSLIIFDEIYAEYSLAANDDLIRFWGSKVKVTAGHRAVRGIHVDAGHQSPFLVQFCLELSVCMLYFFLYEVKCSIPLVLAK